MRIIVFVFGMLFLIGVGGLAIWKMNDDGLLWWEANKFRSDVAELKGMYVKGGVGGNCGSEDDSDNVLQGLQLRFTSETEYVIEPVCSIPTLNKTVIKTGRLNYGVKRLYGSGIRLSSDTDGGFQGDSWVHLTRGKKTVVVGLIDGQAQVEWKNAEREIGGDSPAVANCSDWGFSCCNTGSSIGEGVQVTAVDCLKNCYQTCNQFPRVVFFNTDVMMNQVDRSVNLLTAQEQLRFGYQVSDDSAVDQVTIDFGDGETFESQAAEENNVFHEYKCMKKSCVFTARITASDKSGNSTQDNLASRIKIVMQP